VSPRPWETRFQDILACAYNIRAFTENMSLDSFLVDPKSIRAVAFELVTMGEAARAIPDDIRQQYPQIPWDKMQGLRSILVHEYFRIDEEILWQSSIEEIPELIRELEKLQ
jgi:uncharacterized protein with HEPN domain